MSDVVVTKSPVEVVRPSEPGTPTGIINLSAFDKLFISLPGSVLLLFDEPIKDPVETIKKVLSKALVHYLPMAGRLFADDGIACTGEGVSFVAASASCAIQEVLMTPLLNIRDLIVRYPAEFCSLGDPLLLMQVTEFSCGGFAIGVMWNHVTADGVGMAQFLQAVGELARGMPAPSVIPVRLDVSLSRFPPPPASLLRLKTEELASLYVTVASSLISRVKSESEGGCTVFDVVAAVLWRCRTRAALSGTGSAGGDPVLLTFPRNVREQVGVKHGYYGNCTAGQMVVATADTIASSGIKDIVQLIKRAKENMPELFKDAGGQQEVSGKDWLGYNTLSVSSWRNVGFDTADLGSGRPARVIWPAEKTMTFACVVCPPCKGKDGVNAMSLCVKPEHADEFLGELAALNM